MPIEPPEIVPGPTLEFVHRDARPFTLEVELRDPVTPEDQSPEWTPASATPPLILPYTAHEITVDGLVFSGSSYRARVTVTENCGDACVSEWSNITAVPEAGTSALLAGALLLAALKWRR